VWPHVSMSRFLADRINNWISIIIWVMLTAIFAADVLTPPEIVAVCLAYAVPVFLSLFETKPRTIFYASIATALSLVDWVLQPALAIDRAVVTANIGIAILVQWLIAFLVWLQRERMNDAVHAAERQRRFVNILSHEVGTPLTVIAGQAVRLARLSAPLVLDDLRSRVDKIRTAARRIELLVERIRFASSLESETIPIEYREIDLRTILLQVLEQMREENLCREIELDTGAGPQVIRADEMLLRQMIENIVANSIKYSPESTEITISLSANEHTVSIKIVDHGSGISRHDLSRLGTPYYRGSNSRGVSGTGIGLYVVQKIVEAHGGRLAIDSKLGVGTSVTVDLPR
jgi:signal transduction histidine kinase